MDQTVEENADLEKANSELEAVNQEINDAYSDLFDRSAAKDARISHLENVIVVESNSALSRLNNIRVELAEEAAAHAETKRQLAILQRDLSAAYVEINRLKHQ